MLFFRSFSRYPLYPSASELAKQSFAPNPGAEGFLLLSGLGLLRSPVLDCETGIRTQLCSCLSIQDFRFPQNSKRRNDLMKLLLLKVKKTNRFMAQEAENRFGCCAGGKIVRIKASSL
jgi:hypothetical protein